MEYKVWIILTIILLLIWGSFFYFFINYGEVVRKDPCKVCAERLGKDFICTSIGIGSESVIYSSNKT